MKVFVYKKEKESRKVAQICNVVQVNDFGNKIEIIDKDGATYLFETKHIKTRIYQN